MFEKFTENQLNEWKKLSKEEQKEKISNGMVTQAFDIELIIKRWNRIREKHEFYQFRFSTIKSDILYGVSVVDANEDEITFTFDSSYINAKDQTFKLKEGEEKQIEVGRSPYNATYIIKVSNFVYGKNYEL